MQLDNPKQQRTLAEIVAGIPDSAKVEAAARIAKLNRMISRSQQQDAVSNLMPRLGRGCRSRSVSR